MRENATDGTSRVSRRAALRAGATVGAVGAGLAVGAVGAGPAPTSAADDVSWRRDRVEVDFTPGDPISVVRAGSGPPMRGDTFYMDGPVYAKDDVGGNQAGMYHAFGVWTHDSTETNAPYQLLANVQFRLFAEGTIMGLINGGGTGPAGHEGAVQGGTGQYAGAQGTFRQRPVSTDPRLVVRAVFELLVPE